MTIAPVPQTSDYYHHPRTSSNHFHREIDLLHRLAARMPNTNRDINNNEIGAEPMEICCDTNGFKPTKLNVTLNGDQLNVYGQGNVGKTRKCFGDTFMLPENVDPTNIYCELNPNNQLSINIHQMNFEAQASSMEPFKSASSGGGLW